MIEKENLSSSRLKTPQRVKQLMSAIAQTITQAKTIRKTKKNLHLAAKLKFFQAPTQTILTNSSAQTLIVYENPNFGKRFINSSDSDITILGDIYNEAATYPLPPLNTLIDFVNSFHYVNE
jgi:hypothetical protein